MKNLDKIKKTIKVFKPFLEDKFKVKSLALFGSYLRGEQREESDIDILVELSDVIDLIEFIKLENFLSEILERKVDLVMKETLKPQLKDRILVEAVEV